jgi:two-component system, NarL family, sensor histidine kinase DegS
MKTSDREFIRLYASALQTYLETAGEAGLEEAYELGRQALGRETSLLEMVTLHYEALNQALSRMSKIEDMQATARSSGKFLIESLTPYEMTISGYRETNAALQASEERYRELFENANDIVFTTDAEGRLTSINRAGERLTGYRRDEPPPVPVNVLALEYFEHAAKMFEQLMAGGTPITQEFEILAKDGHPLMVEVSARPILSEGKTVGVQGIARDITERKRAEQALHRLNETLEDRARHIAHELHDEASQILVSVHIAIDGLAHTLPPSGQQTVREVKELIEQIESELRRLSHELRPTILDDLGLVPALEFLSQGVSKRFKLPISVEGTTKGRLAPQLEVALYRITQEALNNMTRHSKATRGCIRMKHENNLILLTITDDGIGFDVPAVLGQKGRQGLGLIGMRERLIPLHGECIINSSPGKGTEVSVLVPSEGKDAYSHSSG